MKKNLLFIICSFFLSVEIFAQIPNNGFENWTNKGTYEEPDNWATLNQLSFGVFPATVTKSTEKNSGSFAARIESMVYTNPFTSTQDTMPGLMSSGTSVITASPFDINLYGFGYTKKPSALTGYFKYSPANNKDSASILVVFTVWNKTKMNRDTIGFGYSSQKNKLTNYTKLSIPIFYDITTSNPDTALIILSSSDFDKPIPGSVLFVDDLSFEGVTGIFSSRPKYNNIVAYPNPSISEINLKNLPSEASFIELTDFTGKVLDTKPVDSMYDEVKIITQNYTAGIYLYNIRNNQGERIASGKFNIVK